jgi:hypothetical protein
LIFVCFFLFGFCSVDKNAPIWCISRWGLLRPVTSKDGVDDNSSDGAMLLKSEERALANSSDGAMLLSVKKSADANSSDGAMLLSAKKCADANSSEGAMLLSMKKSADANSSDGAMLLSARKSADANSCELLARQLAVGGHFTAMLAKLKEKKGDE